jgi:hypothetical protein
MVYGKVRKCIVKHIFICKQKINLYPKFRKIKEKLLILGGFLSQGSFSYQAHQDMLELMAFYSFLLVVLLGLSGLRLTGPPFSLKINLDSYVRELTLLLAIWIAFLIEKLNFYAK